VTGERVSGLRLWANSSSLSSMTNPGSAVGQVLDVRLGRKNSIHRLEAATGTATIGGG
jgi:hypothetical protein